MKRFSEAGDLVVLFSSFSNAESLSDMAHAPSMQVDYFQKENGEVGLSSCNLHEDDEHKSITNMFLICEHLQNMMVKALNTKTKLYKSLTLVQEHHQSIAKGKRKLLPSLKKGKQCPLR